MYCPVTTCWGASPAPRTSRRRLRNPRYLSPHRWSQRAVARLQVAQAKKRSAKPQLDLALTDPAGLEPATPGFGERSSPLPGEARTKGTFRFRLSVYEDGLTGHSIAGRFLSPHETVVRSEEHTSELQSLAYLVCRLLLEKKK